MKVFILVTCIAPGVTWLLSVVHGSLPPADVASWLQGLSSLGFAGFAWYLISIRDPRRDKEHKEERKEWVTQLDRINERSFQNAESGHKAAQELAIQLQRIVDLKVDHLNNS